MLPKKGLILTLKQSGLMRKQSQNIINNLCSIQFWFEEGHHDICVHFQNENTIIDLKVPKKVSFYGTAVDSASKITVGGGISRQTERQTDLKIYNFLLLFF